MKQMRSLSLLLLILLFSTTETFSQSTSWKGTTNVNWNTVTNWTNGIPDATKDVIIGDASFTGINQPKVNVSTSCKSITVGGAVVSTLTMTKGLTISGNFTINSNGTVVHPGATNYLAGNFINNGVYSATATSSRFIFNGTAQTIGGTAPIAFRLVTVNVTSAITLATNISVTGTSSNLTVNGTIDPGQSPAYKVTSTGITKLYGTLKVYTAAFASNYTLTGTTTIYAGAIVNYASTTVSQTVSSAYTYSTLMISGSGIKSLAANLLSLYGKSAIYGKIIVGAGTTFDLGTFTANRATNAAGGELNIANGGTLKIGGTANFPLNFATRTFGVSSTVEYNGVDQTVSAQAYGNLLFSTAGIKTAIIPFSTTGNLTITNGTLNTNAVVITHSVAGNFVMTGGAITGTNYTFNLNGAATQTLNLVSAISKLNINNTAAAIVLAADLTVGNTLNFTKGNIQTGSFNVIIPATASVTGAGATTGWVNGNLQKHIATGVGLVKSFEVGAVSYSPATVFFSSVSIPGELTVTAAAADHAEIDYSGIDPVKSVNRYWSFNNAGILFSTATAIFNWASADVDGGSTTANFKTGLFNGASWSLPVSNTALPTSIQATGLTTLGDFCVGELINKSTWTGAALTSDWFTPKNWLGLIPSAANPTLIPNGIAAGRVYPVLNTGTGIVNDITVETAATLTVSSASLQIAGVITSAANIDASAGTVDFNGSITQHIPAASFTANTIKNLSVSNDVSLDNINIITGTVSVANGKTLTTNDDLILRSDANGTARIAALPVDGSGNATAFITGAVSIERYIPARKAWRLLSAPIAATATTTLQDAWQENAYAPSSFINNPNPNPGYGVHICGGTPANGFDQSTTNSATVKVFNNASNGFVALPPTPGTYVPLNTYPGYLVYIRGDRGIDLSLGVNAPVTSTTLRMKGAVKTGSQASMVNATGFTVLGNPYPSAIDFATLTKSNVKNSFYIWDPKLTGSNGLGAYVTVSWNSGTGSYDITTSASPVSQYIPSGEAILVQSGDSINTGTITIKESDKTANGSDFLFGRHNAPAQELRSNLYEQNADGSFSLLDGTLTTYAVNNSNLVDGADVKKLTTGGESISFRRSGSLLAIERRKTMTGNDTSFLNVAEMKQKMYKLEIIAGKPDQPGFTAVLKDKFSQLLNNTVLNTDGTSEILFSVTDDPASYATDRFSIVFSKTAPGVFAFKSLKAMLQQKNVLVQWQTENESAISSYEVEGSADGIKFGKLTGLNANGGSGSAYSWFDLNATAGDHYYRITSLGVNADRKYSTIMKVNIAGASADSKQLILYPNPVTSNASLQLPYLDRGMYVVELTNTNGQMVKRVPIVHNGGTFKYNLPIDGTMPAGKYQLKLTDGGNVNYTTSMIRE